MRHVSDADLAGYVAGRLDTGRRAEVEGYLAANPDLAAKVMQSLHQQARISEVTHAAPRSGRAMRPAQVVAACCICAVAGWAVAEGLDDDGPFRDLSSIPEYVDDAIRSQQVTHVRIGMASQLETPVLDPDEIQRATRIRMPALPATWRLLDTQVFPSETGPSISVLIEASSGEKLNLFAVLADTSVTDRPVVTTERGETAAYWESGGAAFVLTGAGSERELLSRAAQLSSLSSSAAM